jgi:FMN reductase
LRPVLTELGATTLPGLYLLESTYSTADDVDRYVARWAPVVRALGPALSSRGPR